MIGKTRALGMGGASALAIGTAFFLAPTDALACTAIAQPGAGPVISVAITCSDSTPTVFPFTTRYTNGDGGEIYSGNGADTLTMTGGTISAGEFATPEVTDGKSTYNLDASAGVVQMLGGIDTVNISGAATIGAEAPINLELGDGADNFVMSGGTINGTVFGDEGDDDIEVSGNAIITGVPGVSAAIETGNGDNDVRILGGTIGTDPTQLAVFLDGGGANTFEMSGGAVNGNIVGQGGGNTYTITSGVIDGLLSAGSGNDTVLVRGGTITGDVSGEGGNDTIVIGTVAGGPAIAGSVFGDDGADEVRILGGTIGTTVSPSDVFLGAGADTFQMSGGTITGSLLAGSENDNVTISGNAGIEGGSALGPAVPLPPDAVGLDDGNDTFTMTGGTLGGSVSGNNGDDTLMISGGVINSFVAGDQGVDRITVSGGRVAGEVLGGEGNDVVAISGGTVAGNVLGEDGNDQLTVSAGSVGGSINGGVGTDAVTISGGTITGNVEAETIRLTGGTVVGDFFGISSTTLVIDGTVVGDPLNLRNGVVFSGTNAVATVTNEDLAAGGTKTQTFNGFNTVSASNSTLGFGSGTQGIGLLSLGNGSTLFVNGNANMAGNVVVTGSTINMIDGVADDVFTLGGLTLNGGTIGLDLNQQTGLADQLVAGTFTSSGANTILVNLLGTPEFAQPTDIPIIITTNGPIAGIFAIGVSGTPSALFTYEVIAGANGGLFIRATPANFGIATAPDSAVNASTVNTAIDALYGINDDAIDSDLGLAHGVQRVQISPTFGVFASGQFAHTQHDGFTISGNNLVGPGPSFDADDFSAAISLDFNAAKHFEFEDRYGLNLGLFAGYASTDVGLGAFQGFDADRRCRQS